MASHGPNGPHIEHGHTKTNEHGNQQQAFWPSQTFDQCQGNEGVESEAYLGAGRVVSEVYFVANPWPVRHAVADQDGREAHGKPG